MSVICAHCGKQEGTVRWGDALAITHGGGQMWCEYCALKAQVAHARERMAALPELEARLKIVASDRARQLGPEAA